MDATLAGSFLPQTHARAAGVGQAQAALAAAGTDKAARQAAEDFEAVFLGVMLNGMFEGLDAEPPFGGGHAEETYRTLLVSEYADAIAKSGGVGIADHVYREILAAQEGQTP